MITRQTPPHLRHVLRLEAVGRAPAGGAGPRRRSVAVPLRQPRGELRCRCRTPETAWLTASKLPSCQRCRRTMQLYTCKLNLVVCLLHSPSSCLTLEHLIAGCRNPPQTTHTCCGSLPICHLRALRGDGAITGVLAAAAVVQVVDERRQRTVRVWRQLQRRRPLLTRVQRARLQTASP